MLRHMYRSNACKLLTFILKSTGSRSTDVALKYKPFQYTNAYASSSSRTPETGDDKDGEKTKRKDIELMQEVWPENTKTNSEKGSLKPDDQKYPMEFTEKDQEQKPKKKAFQVYYADPDVADAVYGLREKTSREVAEFHRTDTERSREQFFAVVETYKQKSGGKKRGAVSFVNGALGEMKAHGVHRDLDAYKALVSCFPEGKFVAKSMLMADFMYAPVEQSCMLTVLDYMSRHGVMPDIELGDKLISIFGKTSRVMRKYYRIMYWKPKRINANPHMEMPDFKYRELEVTMSNREYHEFVSLALLKRMCIDPETKYTRLEIEEDGKDEKSFIISAQSPKQKQLLEEHPVDMPLVVEGGFYVWFAGKCYTYFTLRSGVTDRYKWFDTNDPKEDEYDFDFTRMFHSEDFAKDVDSFPTESQGLVELPSVHEQSDGTPIALVMTRTSSYHSLAAWIRALECDNPSLSKLAVLFQLRTPEEGNPIWNGDHEVKNDEDLNQLFPDFSENSRTKPVASRNTSGHLIYYETTKQERSPSLAEEKHKSDQEHSR